MAKKITFCCWTTLRASSPWGDARQMQDGPILPTRLASQNTGFVSPCSRNGISNVIKGFIDWQRKLEEDL